MPFLNSRKRLLAFIIFQLCTDNCAKIHDVSIFTGKFSAQKHTKTRNNKEVRNSWQKIAEKSRQTMIAGQPVTHDRVRPTLPGSWAKNRPLISIPMLSDSNSPKRRMIIAEACVRNAAKLMMYQMTFLMRLKRVISVI